MEKALKKHGGMGWERVINKKVKLENKLNSLFYKPAHEFCIFENQSVDKRLACMSCISVNCFLPLVFYTKDISEAFINPAASSPPVALLLFVTAKLFPQQLVVMSQIK